MPISMTQDVLMVALSDAGESGLSGAAVRNGWPMLEQLSYTQTLREVVTRSPRVVVVQLGESLEHTMNLIGAIRQYKPATKIVVAATVHHELLERAARCAGATAYLPDASDDFLIEQTATSLAETAERVQEQEEQEQAKASKRRGKMNRWQGAGAVAMLFVGFMLSILGANKAQAEIFANPVLHDQNSYAYFNIPGSTNFDVSKPVGLMDTVRSVYDPSQNLGPGITDYPTHDVNQQWFYFSVNGGAVQPINAISLAATNPVQVINTNSSQDSNPDRLILTYKYNSGGQSFGLVVTYNLTGSGLYGSTIGINRTVAITNLTSSTLNLKFYDYSDLTLSRANKLTEEASTYPDYGAVTSTDGRTVEQWDYDGSGLNADGSKRVEADSQTISFKTPTAVAFGIRNDADTTGGIWALLNPTPPSHTAPPAPNLLDTPLNAAGPANLDFAYQYNLSITGFGGWIGGADLLIVPSPSSFSLLVLAAPCLLTGRPRRSRDRRRTAVRPTLAAPPVTHRSGSRPARLGLAA